MENSFTTEGGPPDPINFLRKISVENFDFDDIRRLDSSDNLEILEEQMENDSRENRRETSARIRRRLQDPPARERPAVSD
jgi:hypothetical protein